MANFRGAPTRYGFFHSVSPPLSGGFMDQAPRQMKGEEEESPPSQNLWVGNVSTDVTETMLMETFAKFGDIDNISAYPQRNYAFVYFKHIEHAIAAKEGLQGVPLGGSDLKIEFSRAAKPSKHLWVGGISQTVTKEQLEAEFLKFGHFEDFKLLRERNSALVEYSNLEDAVSAVKFLNGKQLGGDSLRVDYLRSQPVKRESVTNSHMHTVEARNGRFNDRRTFMGSTDLGRRNFDVLNFPPEPPQSILPKVQTPHGHDGGRNQGGQTNILWIGFPPSVKVDDQRLHNALILFGEIEGIKSFPSRHYAFVEFRSVDEARRAKDGLQGRLFNDPRIQILYSNSEFMPVEGTKDSATLMTPLRGMLPPDTLYRSGSQFGSIENLRPINPTNAQGINMHARPVGPWGFPEQHTIESRIPLSRSEPFHKFSDTNINSPRPSGGWNRPPSLIPMGSRPLGPLAGARDGFDGNISLRESKRPRVNEAYPVAGHLDIRKLDNEGTGTLPGYYGTQPDRIISNYINSRSNEDIMGFRESQESPVFLFITSIEFYLMGSCLSCQVTHLTAKLILDDGGLTEFPEPVKVAEILRERAGFFVSHSDSMDYDQYLIPLPAGHQLQVGHLYFLLPQEKLQNPLPSSEMAALAVQAAAALQRKQNKNSSRKCRRLKIASEVGHSMDGHQVLEGFNHLKDFPTLKSAFRATTVGDYNDLWKMKLSRIPEAFDY